MFPSASTRIDAFLHAWDLSKVLGFGGLHLGLALEAITKDSDNTDQSLEKQVNKQRGMGNNYERLEFLGDCYLKLGTSISLFCRSHTDSEFQLHVERMILICNQNLFQKARTIGIPDFIQTQGFSRRTWYPHMKLLHGKKTGVDAIKSNLHRLGDKSVADVCEALIGAALLDQGLDGATKMVSSILTSESHAQQRFKDYYKGYKKPAYQVTPPTAAQQKLADDIEAQFGYRFQSPTLLMSAFTHPSNPWSWEKVPSYQRLEFLGMPLDLILIQF
jgi:endoribonuclease Dicer